MAFYRKCRIFLSPYDYTINDLPPQCVPTTTAQEKGMRFFFSPDNVAETCKRLAFKCKMTGLWHTFHWFTHAV